MTTTLPAIDQLEAMLAKGVHESDSGWFIVTHTNDGLAVISDGLQHGMFSIAAETPQAELIVAAVNRLPALLDCARAADALLAKLVECEPHIMAAIQIATVHSCPYQGPNYSGERETLRLALQMLESGR